MQLTFDFNIDAVIESAIHLLNMLNDGQKVKFEIESILNIEDRLYIVRAQSKNDTLYNVLDCKGNVPEGFSANWRNMHHILSEIK